MHTRPAPYLAIIAALILLVTGAHAQIIPTTETYFTDDSLEAYSSNVQHTQRWGDKMLIGGKNPNEHHSQGHYLALLDTTGTVQWEIDSTVASLGIDRLKIISDSEAVSIMRFNGSIREMWKVHLPTGQVIWKAPVPHNARVTDIAPLSATRFAIGLDIFGSPQKYKIAIVSAIDGDTLRTRAMGTAIPSAYAFPLLHDGAGMLYGAFNSTIYKIDTSIIPAPQWQVVTPLSSFEFIDNISIDSLGRLTCMGRDNSTSARMTVAQANTATGTLLWTVRTGSTFHSHIYQDHIEQGDHIYTAWRHQYVGGTTARHAITKVNKVTQTLEWTCYYQPTAAGMTVTPNSPHNGIIDFDIDPAGNLYTTGYYNDANYGPGAWIVTKVNAANGSVTWEKTITDSTHILDIHSVGIGIHIIQGNIYTIGDAQTFSIAYNANIRTSIHIAKMNTSGNILWRRWPGRTMQYPCRTIEMQPYLDTCTIALLQAGPHAKLRLLDYSQNIIWERYMPAPANTWHKAIDIHVSPDSNIYVLTDQAYTHYEPPFYLPGSPGDPRIFTLSGNGTILRTDSLSFSSSYTVPIKAIHDGTSLYALDYPGGTLRITRVNNGNYTAYTNAFVPYEPIYSESDGFQVPTSGIVMAAYRQVFPAWCRLVWFNSTTLAYLGQCSISAGDVEYVRHSQVANGKVFVGGKGLNGSDYLGAVVPGATAVTWGIQYANNSAITKFDLDSAAQYIYTAGTLTAGPNTQLQLRKVNANTGALVWTRTWQKAGSATITPQAIHFEDDDQRIWITGYRDSTTAPGIQNTWVLVYDQNGNRLDSLFRTGDPAGQHDIPALAPAPYGNIIAGGSLNHQPEGKSGFYWGLDTANVNCATIFSATISGISAPAYCQGQTISLQNTGSSAPTHQWLLNGNTVSTQPATTLTLSSSGTQNLSLISSNGTCSDTATAQFTVHPAPVASINPGGPINLCAGDTATLTAPPAMQYQWFLNGTAIPGANSDSLLATLSGSYTLILTDPGSGCQDSTAIATSINTIQLPPNNVGSIMPPFICPGIPETLQAVPGYAYQWYHAGNPIPGANSSSLVVTTWGQYHVIVTDPQTNCQDISPFIFLNQGVPPPTNITVQGTSPFCAGQPFSIAATTGYQYQWMNNGVPIPAATNNSYNVTATGTYAVQVTDPVSGCQDTSNSHPVVVYSQGIATFTTSTNGHTASFTFTGTTTQTPTWDFGDGSAPQTATNPTHTYAQNGTYLVCLTAYGTNGCDRTTCASIFLLVSNQQQLPEQPFLYPNPATQQVQVILPEPHSHQHLTLLDAQGRQRLHQPIDAQTTTLDLREIPAGLYFLRLTSDTHPTQILHLIHLR